VHRHGNALEYASPDLPNDKEVVLAAVQQDGRALEYASPDLRNDKDVVLAAVRKYWKALEHASLELRSDPGLTRNAHATHPESSQYVLGVARIQFDYPEGLNKTNAVRAAKKKLNIASYVLDQFLI